MNITPVLPNPHQPPATPRNTAVSAVRAPQPARDPADERERRQPLSHTLDRPERERLAVRAEGYATPQAGHSALASRALASYAQVAADSERGSLRELLGFDAYA